MIDQKDVDTIKSLSKEFFEKMTMEVSGMEISLLSSDKKGPLGEDFLTENKDIVNLDVKMDEPQILIGQQGQTLFEIQRLLRMILNRKLKNFFYLNLDINDYKKKKIEYLKDLAKELADQVSLTKQEKSLAPMSAYDRRIIHAEISQRTDVVTESHGEGPGRFIVIKAK